MTIAHLLEDFSRDQVTGPMAQAQSEEEREVFRLEAFEEGYKAGWDDAIINQTDEREKLSTALVGNLEDMSFTFHEALGQSVALMTPLLEQLVAVILPDLARQTIGHRVLEVLQGMIGDRSDRQIEIQVAPLHRTAIEALIDREVNAPVSIIEDATLGEGQVQVRVGSAEQQIDLDAVLSGISEAVDGFLDETKRSLKHA